MTDASDPEQFAATASEVLQQPAALIEAGRAGFAFAAANFAPAGIATRFEGMLEQALGRSSANDCGPVAQNAPTGAIFSPA